MVPPKSKTPPGRRVSGGRPLFRQARDLADRYVVKVSNIERPTPNAQRPTSNVSKTGNLTPLHLPEAMTNPMMPQRTAAT